MVALTCAVTRTMCGVGEGSFTGVYEGVFLRVVESLRSGYPADGPRPNRVGRLWPRAGAPGTE
ncbi:hypothetical protein GCM10010140_52420 [Streptosporangium pseudovulgare]|uniref:Uncharacterized protein n=1 Tax=Streptosporangium pseudovulgare TaxID=35765 RepID=A0ABQ2R609_9ACTN|nr:hypothetical protein GCM10010140_52420 [Streptosporangium pseudovulgare]